MSKSSREQTLQHVKFLLSFFLFAKFTINQLERSNLANTYVFARLKQFDWQIVINAKMKNRRKIVTCCIFQLYHRFKLQVDFASSVKMINFMSPLLGMNVQTHAELLRINYLKYFSQMGMIVKQMCSREILQTNSIQIRMEIQRRKKHSWNRKSEI